MTRDFNKQERDDSRPSFRNTSSNRDGEERSPRPTRPRLNREMVDRAWENGSPRVHADYRPRTSGQPPRNNWQQRSQNADHSPQRGPGNNRPYSNDAQRNERSSDNGQSYRPRSFDANRYPADERRSNNYRGPGNDRPNFNNQRGPGNDRPSFNNQRGPSNDRPAYNNQRGPVGDRPAFNNQRSPGNDRPSFNNQRGPGNDRPAFNNQRGPGNDRPSFNNQRGPAGDRPAYNDQRGPGNDRPSFNNQRGPVGDRPTFNNQRGPAGDRPAFNNQRGPGNDRPSFNNQRGPVGDRPSFNNRGPMGRSSNVRPEEDTHRRGASRIERPQREYDPTRGNRRREERTDAPDKPLHPRALSRPAFFQQQIEAQEKREARQEGREAAQFEGDYEQFGNDTPQQEQEGKRSSFRGPRDERRGPEAVQERHVTPLPDGRVLKGPRPVQRKNAAFWTGIAEDVGGLVERVHPSTDTDANGSEQSEDAAEASTEGLEISADLPIRKPLSNGRPSKRPAASAVRRKKDGTAIKPVKPRSTGPKPSQRGYKWPTP